MTEFGPVDSGALEATRRETVLKRIARIREMLDQGHPWPYGSPEADEEPGTPWREEHQ